MSRAPFSTILLMEIIADTIFCTANTSPYSVCIIYSATKLALYYLYTTSSSIPSNTIPKHIIIFFLFGQSTEQTCMDLKKSSPSSVNHCKIINHNYSFQFATSVTNIGELNLEIYLYVISQLG